MVDTGAEALKQLDEDSLDYTAKELEARLIAGRIRQLVSQGQGILVWDKSRGAYRRARYGDMVILLRSMTGWSEVFVNVLMNEGIPALPRPGQDISTRLRWRRFSAFCLLLIILCRIFRWQPLCVRPLWGWMMRRWPG